MKRDISKHYIIIGGMKCGTTSLFHSLSKNCPSINASRVKDTKFFVDRDRGGNWERGIDWYLAMFPPLNGIKLEASTHYTKYPDYPGVPARIKQVLKNVKLIYLVRDPLQRSISHFFHNLLVDREKLDINQALSTIRNKYINYSDYALQLSQYYDYFAPEDIVIINIVEEEYREKSLEALKHFLGIETSNTFVLERSNTVKDNFVKADKHLNIAPDIINSSENKIELALKFGLSHDNLIKMIDICRVNAVNFKKYYPFTIDHWLDKYKNYLLY
ncbi:MAG: sulfotransferase domain-containing protein [Moorea sp. SIO3G5]|nr:sulfotransferase domain-containing protein [Moorena sp. SIO3G5]